MRFGPNSRPCCDDRPASSGHGRGAFTLVETLAALLFMAIVIPVAIHGIQLATYAGMVSERRLTAIRVADRVLHETFASANGSALGNSGTVQEGASTYRWTTRSEAWPNSTFRLLTATVAFDVQGREHEVRASTLADPASL